MKPVIQIHNLYFSYGDDPVLKDVNLTVQPGEFVGLIGPNGGGKTTLLKLIMGFLKPKSGSIEVFGKPPQSSLPLIGYVPQALRFDKQFPISVMEVVLSGRLAHLPWYGLYSQEDRKKAMEALEMVGIVDLKNRAFGTLSGGQAQRCLIARALVSSPQLLLLDEPTANVDSQVEADIYQLLKKLQKTITILMVTHDLQAVINHVQQVYCVQGVVFALKPEEVCNHFAVGLYHPPLIQVNKKNSI